MNQLVSETLVARGLSQKACSVIDGIMTFDPFNVLHQDGFARLLIEQGLAHGHDISMEHARIVANSIGPEFQTTLICGQLNGRQDVIKGMTTTTEGDFTEGRVRVLEDIVVIPDARGNGYAGQLINHNLVESWELGLAGFAWETGRTNESARGLYVKIDPAFNVENLHDVWRLSPRQCALIARLSSPRAHLAKLDELTSISETCSDNVDRDLGFVSRILERQERNGLHGDSFLVATNSGSFAITSVGYSTFDGSRRADCRVQLKHSKDILELVKGMSFEIARRRWRGAVHIEFGNNCSRASDEVKVKISAAESILRDELGAEPLIHHDSHMVPYIISGKRYVQAVINAVNQTPERPLDVSDSQRLRNAARRHNLVYEQAA